MEILLKVLSHFAPAVYYNSKKVTRQVCDKITLTKSYYDSDLKNQFMCDPDVTTMTTLTKNQFFQKNLVNTNQHAKFDFFMTFGLEVR